MKLYAHTYAKVWGEWDDVAAWWLEGPRLHIAYAGPTRGSGHGETVTLPREVVGLRDNGPARVVAVSRSGERPDPVRRERSEYIRPASARAGDPSPPPPQLRIPDREPPRARFGDRPRKARGSGS